MKELDETRVIFAEMDDVQMLSETGIIDHQLFTFHLKTNKTGLSCSNKNLESDS